MNGHPGGIEHTEHMLELSKLPSGSKIIDLGAGAGETVARLNDLGYQTIGIDLLPRSENVQYGNMLCPDFEDGSFDAVISQCAFFQSGNATAALAQAYRLLKSGGMLMLSDVFFEEPEPWLKSAGFDILATEDMSAQWREYYIDAIWRGEEACCCRGKKCRYWLVICRKEA